MNTNESNKKSNESFAELVESLNASMIEDYVAVNKQNNPIAIAMQSVHSSEQEHLQQLCWAVEQYSYFPKYISSFLSMAKDAASNAGWDSAAAELERNIGEERGSRTNGITHYNMLLNGLRDEIGLTIPAYDMCSATRAFKQEMTDCFTASKMLKPETSETQITTREHFVEYAMGAIYANESTAIPELEIVIDIVNQLAIKKTGAQIKYDGTLAKFFDGHLNVWEPGHESGLREAIQPYMSKEGQDHFESGFRDVMQIMDRWWNGMHSELSELLEGSYRD